MPSTVACAISMRSNGSFVNGRQCGCDEGMLTCNLHFGKVVRKKMFAKIPRIDVEVSPTESCLDGNLPEHDDTDIDFIFRIPNCCGCFRR